MCAINILYQQYMTADSLNYSNRFTRTICFIPQGGSILRMINYTLSEATFHKAIQVGYHVRRLNELWSYLVNIVWKLSLFTVFVNNVLL